MLFACVHAQGFIIGQGAVVNAKNSYIALKKNFSNNGTFVQNGGAVIFNGASQTLNGATQTVFDNMSIAAGSSTAITASGQSLKTALLCNGTLNTNGNLTLLSTASQTAYINGSGTGNVLGNVIMQRYLSSAFGYKYFSSPFQSATVNEFSDEVNLSSGFPLFYRYDENQASTGWLTYTISTGTLVPLQGYAANLGTSHSAETVDATGVVNNGTITSTLYNHNQPYTQGFNLVGNPYPSPIDWNAATGWTRTNVDNAVYYFNASATDQYGGTYSSYINGISSDGIANNMIASMQGFFVHVTNGTYPVSATLSINNNARTTSLSPVFQSFAPPLIRLSAGFSDDGLAADRTVFYIDDNAAANFDTKRDALKLMNTNKDVPSLYAVAADTTKLSIHAFAYPHDSTVLPLGIKTERDGWITFNAPQIQLISASLHIYLFDDKDKSYHDLRSNNNYRLYLSSGKYENRFSLVFSTNELGATTADDATFNAYFSAGKLIVNTNMTYDDKAVLVMINMQGQTIWHSSFTGNGTYNVNTRLSNDVYVVRLVAGKQEHSKKIFINN